MVSLTTYQEKILKELLHLIDVHKVGYKNYMFSTTVGGYAGTGKTTLICELRRRMGSAINTAFVTFTGKASSVLSSRLKQEGVVNKTDYCGTIHGLIYKAIMSYSPELKTYVISGWKRKEKGELYHDLIIIDEASMVSKEIWMDLVYFGIPIIAFGDHGQLPPINDNSFSLIQNPNLILVDIHRQALNSPIIRLSQFIRKEGYIPTGYYTRDLCKLNWNLPDCKNIWNSIPFESNDTIILCGFNKTRDTINKHVRGKLNYTQKRPYPCEKVICLANNHQSKIMNGQIGVVMWAMPAVKDGAYKLTVDIDSELYDCFVSDSCFGKIQYDDIYNKSVGLKKLRMAAISEGYQTLDFFDYGYAISVHKSQGSEWSKVVLVEQRTSKWDDEYYARWLYTAVTRAKQKLFIISDFNL